MKMQNKKQQGFAVVELILVAFVLVAIGVVGFKIANKNKPLAGSNSPAATTHTSLPSKISSKSEVTKSIQAIDSTPINSKLDPSQLDGDLNSLL